MTNRTPITTNRVTITTNRMTSNQQEEYEYEDQVVVVGMVEMVLEEEKVD